ncbi:hypothetical protein [Segatella albensis]|nr:hypothetical protein [Segatella albensis]
MGMQGITDFFSPLGQEKFLLAGTDGKKFLKKNQGIRHMVLAEYGLH